MDIKKTKEPAIRFKGFTGNWEQRKLSDIATFINGRAYKQQELLEFGKYPVLRVGNFGTNNQWYYSDLELDDKFYANNGDLLYTWATAFGPHIWDGKKVIYHYHIWKIELSEHLDRDYALQLLESDKAKLLANTNGSTMIHVTKNEMESKMVSVSSIEEQRLIGIFLKELDHLITLHQRELDLMKQQKKSLLSKMFPKNGAEFPELRFIGYTNPWEQRKLGELMEITSLKRIHQSDWTNSGVRFLRARDIVAESKKEEVTEPLFISQEKYDEYSALSGKAKIGDLLVTGVGTIGVPMLINSEEPLYFKDGNIIWFKNEDAIDGSFFYHSFNGDSIQKFIRESTGTGTVGTYTIESGKKTPLYLPHQKEEQVKIGTFFSRLDNLITLHQRKLETLKSIKKSFLAKMFV
ncbi:restriction endonuclease subunit S [Ohessyouella blattaphilus]|uniref:Restriction endonuclease subunit S n=1 Tax=Ohessyouella blattaphilus TaxID=2949333 RepID=A0ABT1EGM1_9FIRM|nr:restriction endonuclease subunit S [Ohessyouella blattaphilus]MCP1108912.1 restriction endonuclease subunit S [Ohessyouella blattaphilus]MCR8562306.1 restriction endonuclease subunit S [Ohessyouella blattaphilus]